LSGIAFDTMGGIKVDVAKESQCTMLGNKAWLAGMI
jgi:hypothetical protein